MSDFLSQFEKDKYKKEEGAINSAPKNVEKNIETSVNKSARQESKSKNRAIETVDHETEIDSKYDKRKIILYISVAATVIVLSLIIFFAIRFANLVTIKNFVGTNINDAKTWGLKNHIELETDSVFDLEYGQDIIISQDKQSGDKLSKGSILSIKVSKGADPDERVELPDFSIMNLTQIQEWINKNKTNNISIIHEFNEEIERSKFIKKEFKKDIVDETNFTRKDGINIYVSKGPEVLEKNITVPNFKDKSKADVDSWAKTNDVEIRYTESGSNKVLEGLVISQDVEPESKVAKKDIINIVVSKGKGVIVPNFSNISKEEAVSATDGLQVNIVTKYHATIAYGKIISQSVKSGTTLYGEDKKVQVVYSEGRPYIEDIKGKTEKDLAPYFYGFVSKGANISYNVNYVDSSEKKGSVVWTSKCEEFIGMEETIEVHISKGNIVSNNVNSII